MSGTYTVTVGDRGRIVVPQEVRKSADLHAGTSLVLLDTPDGLVLLTQKQLLARVRSEYNDIDLVSDLLADRRKAAATEDANT
jgi:AbrB family looped-hinge helix DNA binding protein